MLGISMVTVSFHDLIWASLGESAVVSCRAAVRAVTKYGQKEEEVTPLAL